MNARTKKKMDETDNKYSGLQMVCVQKPGTNILFRGHSYNLGVREAFPDFRNLVKLLKPDCNARGFQMTGYGTTDRIVFAIPAARQA